MQLRVQCPIEDCEHEWYETDLDEVCDLSCSACGHQFTMAEVAVAKAGMMQEAREIHEGLEDAYWDMRFQRVREEGTF